MENKCSPPHHLQASVPINLNIIQKTVPPFFFFINLAVLPDEPLAHLCLNDFVVYGARLQKRKMAETEKTRLSCSLGIGLQMPVPAYFSLRGFSALASGRQRKICRQIRNLPSACSKILIQSLVPISLNIIQKTVPICLYAISESFNRGD